jgi:DNA repair protein REV1
VGETDISQREHVRCSDFIIIYLFLTQRDCCDHSSTVSTVGHVAMEPTVPQASQSNSSDYFEDEDSQFLEALGRAILPGDLPKEHDPEESQELQLPPPSQACVKRRYSHISSDEEKNDSELNVIDNEIYGASHFGGFGEYMRRKRAKLQIQNAGLEQPGATDHGARTQILKGIAVYVSPYTESGLVEANSHG